MILAEAIEETYDENMQSYYSSEEFKTYDKKANDTFDSLMADIPDEFGPRLQEFYDAMMARVASEACNAYVNGVYVGITDRESFLEK